jgi:transcriptional regulator with XRE-family HTH domain
VPDDDRPSSVEAHIRSDILPVMDVPAELRSTRLAAGLSQAEIARRAGTSQATVSQYESGRKRPGIGTFARLVEAAGAEVRVGPPARPVVRPTAAQLDRAGRVLEEVLELAALLPTRHPPRLPVPDVRRPGGAPAVSR